MKSINTLWSPFSCCYKRCLLNTCSVSALELTSLASLPRLRHRCMVRMHCVPSSPARWSESWEDSQCVCVMCVGRGGGLVENQKSHILKKFFLVFEIIFTSQRNFSGMNERFGATFNQPVSRAPTVVVWTLGQPRVWIRAHDHVGELQLGFPIS